VIPLIIDDFGNSVHVAGVYFDRLALQQRVFFYWD
jgi:hypothetical protein